MSEIIRDAEERATDLHESIINGNWQHVAGELLEDRSTYCTMLTARLFSKLDREKAERLLRVMEDMI